MAEPEPAAGEFPSVDAAYAFVVPSYQMLLSRFEAADTRINSILTLTLSITLGTPVFVRALRPDAAFDSPLFLVAVALATIAVSAGILGRVWGHIVLPDPMVMHQTSLHLREHSFKLFQIEYAGKNFERNNHAIGRKGAIGIGMTFSLGWQVLLLVLWLTA